MIAIVTQLIVVLRHYFLEDNLLNNLPILAISIGTYIYTIGKGSVIGNLNADTCNINQY